MDMSLNLEKFKYASFIWFIGSKIVVKEMLKVSNKQSGIKPSLEISAMCWIYVSRYYENSSRNNRLLKLKQNNFILRLDGQLEFERKIWYLNDFQLNFLHPIFGWVTFTEQNIFFMKFWHFYKIFN